MENYKVAHYGEYVIFKNAEGAISVGRDYENDKAALREIAGEAGFEYDLGWKLVNLAAN